MAKITNELLLGSIENSFVLVHVLTERIKELKKGARPLVETDSNDVVEIATREIIEGKLEYKYGS